MAIPRARGGTSPSTRWSPMWISPDVGRSSPAIMRSRVVFPEPEEPSKTRNSPSRIDRSTPSTAWRSPKYFFSLRISTPATAPPASSRSRVPPSPRPPVPPVPLEPTRLLFLTLAAVGRGVGRLRQAHRRVVDDAVWVLGHLELPHHVRWRAGLCRPRAGPASAARGEGKEGATERCNQYARWDRHVGLA